MWGLPAWCRADGLVAAWGDDTYGETTLPEGVREIKAISAGEEHSLALKADGTVIAWGSDYAGSGATNVPPGLTNVVAVAASADWSMALNANGTVAAWGAFGEDFQVSGLTNVTAIAAGWYHWLALKADGTIATYGVGVDSYDPAYPTNIPPGLTNVTAVAAGLEYSMVLKADSSVVAWGWDEYGQTNVPAGLSNVVAIAAGYYHALALKDDGTVVAWGYDASGQIDVPTGLSDVVAISAGEDHSLALTADGTVVAWGAGGTAYQNYGQAAVPPDLAYVTAISAGGYHSLALTFDGPVQITQDPQSQGVAYTSNATFSVTASGLAPLYYQWLFNGSPLANSDRITGATNSSLNISNAQFSDIGAYSVVVSNEFGSVISTGAAFNVISPPFITSEFPASLTVPAGNTVYLAVTAQGTPPLSYQWTFNGTNLPGATGTTLAYLNAQPAVSGIYVLVVTNLYGTAQSYDLVVTVTNSPPYILTQPVGQTLALYQSSALSVAAAGSLPLSYQWRFNGANLPGATNTTLKFASMNFNQAGYYDAVVANPFGDIVSTKVLMSVQQPYVWGNSLYNAPTNEPPGLSNVVAVALGTYHMLVLKRDGTVATWGNYYSVPSALTNVPGNVTNVVAIAANGNSSMALRANGTVAVWGDNNNGQTNVPAAVSNIVAIADSDNYSGPGCLALKLNGTIIEWGGNLPPPAGLSNVVAVATENNEGLALKGDGTVTFWASGTNGTVPGLTNAIAISANGTSALALKADGHIVILAGYTGSIPASATNVVAIAASYNNGDTVLKSDGSVISWEIQSGTPAGVSNVIAIAAPSTSVSYLAAVVGDGSPFITLQPANQTVTNGANIQLHVRAVGLQPLVTNTQPRLVAPKPLSYQWLLAGALLPGATNADLAISNVQVANTGNYQVRVTNVLGAVTSMVAQLTVPISTNIAVALNATNYVWSNVSTNPPWFAETFVMHDGLSAAQSGAIGNNQLSGLKTSVTGPGTVTFWWKVSSEEGYDFLNFYVDSTNTALAAISGAVDWQQLSFPIAAGTHTLEWIYAKDPDVSAGQDAGWLDQVTFTPPPPQLTQQPMGQTLRMGARVTFSGLATGVAPLVYQWLKNGTNLPHAQATSLTLTNLTRHDSGVYALQVTNAGGSVLTSNATLVVLVPQRLSAPGWLPGGGFTLISGDADGGLLVPTDLGGFSAQTSTDLVNWQTLTNGLTLTNGVLQLTDPGSTNFPWGFYRVIEQ